ncbi:response regulator, partial [Patescibacteria group bacterium]|nr:response regulator [Patescibacteria group bacterium]
WQEPSLLTQSINPYIRKGLMKLIDVADLSHAVERSTATRPTQAPVAPPNSSQSKPIPLIAYIDDSRMDSKIMGQVLTKAGLRYINIQDSVQALPMLLEQRPSLIFLDLVMPIANGYEICAQIRRTSIFKDTPVIIVTGNDGIVDRVRAKIVRSTDFLAKPIDTKKVLAIIRKYLPVQNSVEFGFRNRQNT